VKLAEGSSNPTGAMAILDDVPENPLLVLGMSGGTLLVMSQTYDDSEGYAWD
jgi:hypothetical protein